MKDSTTIVRTNEVTVSTIAGSSERALRTAMISIGVLRPSGPKSFSPTALTGVIGCLDSRELGCSASDQPFLSARSPATWPSIEGGAAESETGAGELALVGLVVSSDRRWRLRRSEAGDTERLAAGGSEPTTSLVSAASVVAASEPGGVERPNSS